MAAALVVPVDRAVRVAAEVVRAAVVVVVAEVVPVVVDSAARASGITLALVFRC